MNVNLAVLHDYEQRGLLRSATHPTMPLTIWNYTDKVMWERAWDDVTTLCRGLIVDHHGDIVARPFPKFFNLDEYEALVGSVPNESFSITEKLDGSLIIVTLWKPPDALLPQAVVATRGSFVSEQARRAKQMLTLAGLSRLQLGVTLCFEILYPENRIVVDYGDRAELVLLAAFANETGEELPVEEHGFLTVPKWPAQGEHVEVPRTIDFRTLPERPNEEGYVIRFDSGLRVKLKNAEYVRLHRLLTGTTARRVWEAMRDGHGEELLAHVPEEFSRWVAATMVRIDFSKQTLFKSATEVVASLDPALERREKAEIILRAGPPISSVAFMLLDGKDPSALLWRLVKPEAGDVPFRSPS